MALGDNELVALVLGTGTRSRGALVVAQNVIAMAGGVPGLVRVTLDELDGVRVSACRERRACWRQWARPPNVVWRRR